MIDKSPEASEVWTGLLEKGRSLISCPKPCTSLQVKLNWRKKNFLRRLADFLELALCGEAKLPFFFAHSCPAFFWHQLLSSLKQSGISFELNNIQWISSSTASQITVDHKSSWKFTKDGLHSADFKVDQNSSGFEKEKFELHESPFAFAIIIISVRSVKIFAGELLILKQFKIT